MFTVRNESILQHQTNTTSYMHYLQHGEDEDNIPLSELRPTKSAPSSRRPSSSRKSATQRRPSQPAVVHVSPYSLLDDSSDDDDDHIPIAERATGPSAAEKYKKKVLQNLQDFNHPAISQPYAIDDDNTPLVVFSKKQLQRAMESRKPPLSSMRL
ncbi:hypothetical protein EC973_002221 [Apophysomyces ossiformis]|uniref:Uncharacterized protein n=1 Tax=Apophysomyces ossiformis TaxID=679940 RepID=A0A8H7BUA9_9FUNG|nr:hypothetical protein EC973_002221 [Apophysomyces ossiformis]